MFTSDTFTSDIWGTNYLFIFYFLFLLIEFTFMCTIYLWKYCKILEICEIWNYKLKLNLKLFDFLSKTDIQSKGKLTLFSLCIFTRSQSPFRRWFYKLFHGTKLRMPFHLQTSGDISLVSICLGPMGTHLLYLGLFWVHNRVQERTKCEECIKEEVDRR